MQGTDKDWLDKTFKQSANNWKSPYTNEMFTQQDKKLFDDKLKDFKLASPLIENIEEDLTIIEKQDAETLLRFAKVLCESRNDFSDSELLLIEIQQIMDHSLFFKSASKVENYSFNQIKDAIEALNQGANAHIIDIVLWKNILHHFPSQFINRSVPAAIRNAARHHSIHM